MTNLKPVGRTITTPKRIEIEIGIIEKVYVKCLFGFSYSKYLLKFPEIVKTTTKVQMIQNGPYKSGFF